MAHDRNAFGGWIWMGRYVAVIVLSLILAAALGHMSLFEKATLGSKLSASRLVEFLGFGAALTAFWMLGQRTTLVLQKQGGRWSVLHHVILPVVSLIVVALAYSVVLLLLKPFMGATAEGIFNWTFIAAILACSGWLIVVVFNQSGPLLALLAENRHKAR